MESDLDVEALLLPSTSIDDLQVIAVDPAVANPPKTHRSLEKPTQKVAEFVVVDGQIYPKRQLPPEPEKYQISDDGIISIKKLPFYANDNLPAKKDTYTIRNRLVYTDDLLPKQLAYEVAADGTIDVEKPQPQGEILPLVLIVNGLIYDVYNCTQTFDGENIIGRAELRDSEQSQLYLFRYDKIGKRWIAKALGKPYQDGALFTYTDKSDGKVKRIMCGVNVTWQQLPNHKMHATDWRTRFHPFDIQDGKPIVGDLLFEGPPHMKDMRLFVVDSPFGQLFGLLLRPQGGKAYGGRISVVFGTSIEDLKKKMTPDIGETAFMLPFEIGEALWIGGNQAEIRTTEDEKGKTHYYLCILGHIAEWIVPKVERKYDMAAMILEFELVPGPAESIPKNKMMGNIDIGEGLNFVYVSCSQIKRLVSSDNFPKTPAKDDTLWRVVFTGGVNEYVDGQAHVNNGLRDTTSCTITLPEWWTEMIAQMQAEQKKLEEKYKLNRPNYSIIPVPMPHTAQLPQLVRV